MSTTNKPSYKRKYVRVADRRQGLPSSKRPKVTKDINANQWTLTPRQLKFAEYYFLPKSETYANAYQSAIKAGYKHQSAIKITSQSQNLEWIADARSMLANYTPHHIQQAYQKEYETATTAKDRLHALDSMSKVLGMQNNNNTTEINVNFNNSVPRPVIDLTDNKE